MMKELMAKIEEARQRLMKPTEEHNIGGLEGLKKLMKKKQGDQDATPIS